VANASSGAGGGTGKGQASTLFTFVADDPHAMASLINGSGLHPHGFNASHANSHAILHKTRTPLAKIVSVVHAGRDRLSQLVERCRETATSSNAIKWCWWWNW
jgi:hypothetical protein